MKQQTSKHLFKQKDPMIIDKIGVSEDFLNWLDAELGQWDFSLVEWFKLLPLTQNHEYRGRCTYPVRVKKGSTIFKRGYRITNSVHIDSDTYPYVCKKIKQSTIAVAPSLKDSADFGKYSNHWEYTYVEETFADKEELLAYICGHELYHFLRYSKQIGGRNTEPFADRYGIEILNTWRVWKEIRKFLDD